MSLVSYQETTITAVQSNTVLSVCRGLGVGDGVQILLSPPNAPGNEVAPKPSSGLGALPARTAIVRMWTQGSIRVNPRKFALTAKGDRIALSRSDQKLTDVLKTESLADEALRPRWPEPTEE